MAYLEKAVDQDFCNRVYECERIEQLFPTKRSFQSALKPPVPPFMEVFVGEEEFCHFLGEDNFLICLNFVLSLVLNGAFVVAEKARKHSESSSNR